MTLLAQERDPEVTVFLMGDAVTCAKAGQKSPNGCYNLEERMLKPIKCARARCCSAAPA